MWDRRSNVTPCDSANRLSECKHRSKSKSIDYLFNEGRLLMDSQQIFTSISLENYDSSRDAHHVALVASHLLLRASTIITAATKITLTTCNHVPQNA